MTLALWFVALVAGLALLVWSADKFTETAEKIGTVLKIPSFIIGVTVVSVGTSLPELITSLIAVFQGAEASQIVVGNAMGSNIFNVLMGIGVVVLFIRRPMGVKRSLIDLDLPLLALATALLALMLMDGNIVFWEGLVLIAGFAVYIRYTMSGHAREKVKVEKAGQVKDEDIDTRPERRKVSLKLLALIVVFGALIYCGARLSVEAVLQISDMLNIASSIIAVSAIAIGTSLPELVVSAQAARRGNYEIAIGNVVGSCIFNALIVVGLPALIGTLLVPEIIIGVVLPFFIASALLFVISGITRRIHVYEGAFYVLIYVIFMAKLFNIF